MARVRGKMDFVGTIGGARVEAGSYDLYSSGVLSLNTLNDLTFASDNRNISLSGQNIYMNASGDIAFANMDEFNIASQNMTITLARGEYIRQTTPQRDSSGVVNFRTSNGFIGGPCSGIQTNNSIHIENTDSFGGSVQLSATRDIISSANINNEVIAGTTCTVSGGDTVVAAYDAAKSLGAVFVLANNYIALGASNYAHPYTPDYFGCYASSNSEVLVQGGPDGGHGFEATLDNTRLWANPNGGYTLVSGGIVNIRSHDTTDLSGIVNIYPDAGALVVGSDNFARPFTPENIDFFSTSRMWQKIYNGGDIIGVEFDGDSDNQIDFITSDGKRPAVNGSGIALYSEITGGGNHNDLTGLQGGTASEYYHLTQDEYENGQLFPSGYVGKGAINLTASTNGDITVSGGRDIDMFTPINFKIGDSDFDSDQTPNAILMYTEGLFTLKAKDDVYFGTVDAGGSDFIYFKTDQSLGTINSYSAAGYPWLHNTSGVPVYHYGEGFIRNECSGFYSTANLHLHSDNTIFLTSDNGVGLTIDDGTDHQFDFATTDGKRPHVNGSGVLLEGEAAEVTEAYFFGRLTSNIACSSTLQNLNMDHGDLQGMSHTDGTHTVYFDTAGRYIIDVFLRTTYNIGGHLATLQASYWNGFITVLLDDRQAPTHATSNNHVHLRYFYNTTRTDTYWNFKVKTTKTLPGTFFTVEDSYVIITREYEE